LIPKRSPALEAGARGTKICAQITRKKLYQDEFDRWVEADMLAAFEATAAIL
jgi:hypothetical protein